MPRRVIVDTIRAGRTTLGTEGLGRTEVSVLDDQGETKGGLGESTALAGKTLNPQYAWAQRNQRIGIYVSGVSSRWVAAGRGACPWVLAPIGDSEKLGHQRD